MAIRPLSAVNQLRQSAVGPVVYSEPAKPIFFLFLAYVVYMYLQGGYRWPALGAVRFEFLSGAILLPIAIGMFRRGRCAEERPVLKWSLLLLGMMLIMVGLSQAPAYSWDVFWNRGIKFAAYGVFIVAFVTSPRNLRWFLVAFILAFFKMGLEGLIGTITGALIWQNQEIPRLHGSTPSYQHPNSFSGTQLGAMPFLYFLYPIVPWIWRIALIVQFGLCMNVVLRTGSRTGYLAFLAAVGSFVWLSKARFRAVIMVFLVGFAAVPFIPQEYIGRFSSIFEEKSQAGDDTSSGQRKEILVDATTVFQEYPLGVGVGAFPIVRQQMFGRNQDTHNLYLEVATNLGIQGVIVFVGFISAIWLALVRLRRRLARHLELLDELALTGDAVADHVGDIRLFLACAKAVWVFLIIRLVLGAFGMDMYEIYWWFMSGLTVALLRLAAIAERRTISFAKEAGKPVDPAKFKPRQVSASPRLRAPTVGKRVARDP